MYRSSLLCSIAAGLVFASCAAPAADSAPADTAADNAAAEAALRSTVERMITAYENEDVEALSAFFEEDVVLLPPELPAVQGRAAQMESLADFPETDYTIDSQIRDLLVSGDLGVTFIQYSDSSTPRAGGEATESSGRWALIWNRGADGQWRVYREIWNLSPPADAGS